MQHKITLSDSAVRNINNYILYDCMSFIILLRKDGKKNEWCVWYDTNPSYGVNTTTCRESACTYINGVLIKSNKKIDDIKIGIFYRPSGKNVNLIEKKMEAILNILHSFEKRYRWKKTELIKPEVVVFSNRKNSRTSSLSSLASNLYILNSSSKWLTNTPSASIFMLLVRAATKFDIYDNVKVYKDVCEVNNKFVDAHKIDKEKPLSYTPGHWANLKPNKAVGDKHHIIATNLLWDVYLKNLKTVIKDKDTRLTGNNGILNVLYSIVSKEFSPIVNKTIDLPALKKMIEAKGGLELKEKGVVK